jgi:hypothetical protein
MVSKRRDKALQKLKDLPEFPETILATSRCPNAKEPRPGFVRVPSPFEIREQYLRYKKDFKVGMKVEHEHAGECTITKLLPAPGDPANLLVEVEYEIWLYAEKRTEMMRQQYLMFYHSDRAVGDWHDFGYSFKYLKEKK